MTELAKLNVVWSGLRHNWLGDASHQIIIKVTDRMGVSVLGPQRRVDFLYGLPDRTEPGFHDGVQGMIQRLQTTTPDQDRDYKLAAVKFLRGDEHPGLPPDPESGLRFTPVGYIGIEDSFNQEWSPTDILLFIQVVHQHDEAGIRPDAYLDYEFERKVAYHHFLNECERLKVYVYLDPTNPCSAAPHPVTKPYEYVYTNLNGSLPEKGTLAGVFVWTNPNQYCYDLEVRKEADKLYLYKGLEESPLNEPKDVVEAGIKYRLPISFKSFVEQLWLRATPPIK